MEKPPVVLYLEGEPSPQYHASRDALAYILAQRGCLLERVQVTPPFLDRTIAIATWVESDRLQRILLDEVLAPETRVIAELLWQVAPNVSLAVLSHHAVKGYATMLPNDAASLHSITRHLPRNRPPLPHSAVPPSVRAVFDREWKRLRRLSAARAAALVATLTRIAQEELRRQSAEAHGADHDGSYQRHVGFAFHPATGQRCIVGGFGDHKEAITYLRARIVAIRQWGVAAPGDVVFGTVTHGVPGYETPILQVLSVGLDWAQQDCAALVRFLCSTAMYLPIDHVGRPLTG